MIRFLTAGESHGPELTAIIEGLPAGLPLTAEDINPDLARRQEGYGSGGRMQIERDQARITSGVAAGKTTGAPIALTVVNRDFKNWREKDITPMTTPRPGHADLTGAIKYGYRDLRVALERASARETAMRVAVGAICRRLLTEFGIRIGGYVVQIGDAVAHIPDDLAYEDRFTRAEASDVRCPLPDASAQMHAVIHQAKIDKDTLGGVIEVVALGVPPGLGSHVHYDRRLDGRIVAAMVSVHAMKGAEIGPAFAIAGKRGSEVHDEISLREGGDIYRTSNRAGGLEGGITTGEPIVARVAMKPISTVMKALGSINLATGEPERTTYERSDHCATPRAVPILEAMMAFVLADALLEKIGGDSIDEMRPALMDYGARGWTICRWTIWSGALAIQSDRDVSRAAHRFRAIVLTGFMGTGKSTVGQAVAARLGWGFVDSDAEIMARAGVSIPEIFAQQGEPAFRRIEREVVCALVDGQQVVIATGGGALIDDETRAYALAHALVICLTATPEAIAARLVGDTERPLLKGDWRALLERRRPIYESFSHQLDTTGKAPEALVEEVLAIWQNAST